MKNLIKASQLKEGQRVSFKIDGEWKVEAKINSAWKNDEGEIVVRASGCFLTLNALEDCILMKGEK